MDAAYRQAELEEIREQLNEIEKHLSRIRNEITDVTQLNQEENRKELLHE